MALLRRTAALMLSFRGEIGRRAFLGGVVAGHAVFIVLALLTALAAKGVFLLASLGMPRDQAIAIVPVITVLTIVLMAVPFIWSMLALAAKRHRALNLPGWTGPAALIILVGASTVGVESGFSVVWINLLFLAWFAALCLWPSLATARRRAVEAF